MDKQQQKWYTELYERIAGDYKQAAEDQMAVWEGRTPKCQPLLLHGWIPKEQSARFPDYNPGEIHHDKDKMLLYGMKQMLGVALQGAPSLRANMGCGIYPSLFPGIEPLLFDDGKMPWVVKHLTPDEVRNLREKDIRITDEFKLALEHMVYLAEKVSGSGACVYPLDLQGPFDTAHLVYGDRIFYDLYDEPELIHHLLDLSVHAINLGLDECLKILPNSDKFIAHYNDVVIPRSMGGIKISEDTSTLVSAEHIEEFVIPYSNRVLRHAGGGYIHYCGKNDTLFEWVLEQELICGLNFGNPEKHDIDEALRRLAAAGKVYYGDIRKNENEDYPAFFLRLKKSATVDGKCKLLLVAYAASEEDDCLIRDAWRKACAVNEFASPTMR